MFENCIVFTKELFIIIFTRGVLTNILAKEIIIIIFTKELFIMAVTEELLTEALAKDIFTKIHNGSL